MSEAPRLPSETTEYTAPFRIRLWVRDNLFGVLVTAMFPPFAIRPPLTKPSVISGLLAPVSEVGRGVSLLYGRVRKPTGLSSYPELP